jgi:hypothetical protein
MRNVTNEFSFIDDFTKGGSLSLQKNGHKSVLKKSPKCPTIFEVKPP